MKISFIIATYNVENSLEVTLKSIICQDNLNYEIIDEIENMYILYKIPGVEKKDISVLLSKGKLIIKAVCNIDFHTFNIKYNDIIEVPNDTVNTDLTVSFFMGLLKIKINKIKKSN